MTNKKPCIAFKNIIFAYFNFKQFRYTLHAISTKIFRRVFPAISLNFNALHKY